MAGRRARPLEYSLLYTATLCMLAAGAVMVYSASSAESLLGGSGDPLYYLKRYVAFGLVGFAVMELMRRRGLRVVRSLTGPLLGISFFLTLAVMVPGIGVNVNGATRWLAAGPVRFQPSELLKLALVLYACQLLATRPRATCTLGGVVKPLLLVVGAACLLLLAEPDMGTAIVVALSIAALLVAAGVPLRHLGVIAAAILALALIVAVAAPYRRARLTSFVDPFADARGSGFQTVQSLVAVGSGGLFGVGLGESVQKIFYLPEAHTDMILAVIAEELGLVGVASVAFLYGMVAYAGLRTAKLAAERYPKLLAAGITSLIACQATLNFFAVLGLAPLTGVPLPFISYGSSNLVVMMAGMGLLLNVAATGGRAERATRPRLRAIDGGGRAAHRDRGRRHRGSRRAGARGRRRAAGEGG
jgi:cell division protein FtsW